MQDAGDQEGATGTVEDVTSRLVNTWLVVALVILVAAIVIAMSGAADAVDCQRTPLVEACQGPTVTPTAPNALPSSSLPVQAP